MQVVRREYSWVGTGLFSAFVIVLSLAVFSRDGFERSMDLLFVVFLQTGAILFVPFLIPVVLLLRHDRRREQRKKESAAETVLEGGLDSGESRGGEVLESKAAADPGWRGFLADAMRVVALFVALGFVAAGCAYVVHCGQLSTVSLFSVNFNKCR